MNERRSYVIVNMNIKINALRLDTTAKSSFEKDQLTIKVNTLLNSALETITSNTCCKYP